MQDFSKCSGLVVLQPEQKNITGTPFSKINLTARRRFRCCLLTMVKKNWVRKKKWLRTLAIYHARKNSEKRHKREDVTTSVLNKKGLPRNVLPKQTGQTFRWDVGTFDTLGTFRRV